MFVYCILGLWWLIKNPSKYGARTEIVVNFGNEIVSDTAAQGVTDTYALGYAFQKAWNGIRDEINESGWINANTFEQMSKIQQVLRWLKEKKGTTENRDSKADMEERAALCPTRRQLPPVPATGRHSTLISQNVYEEIPDDKIYYVRTKFPYAYIESQNLSKKQNPLYRSQDNIEPDIIRDAEKSGPDYRDHPLLFQWCPRCKIQWFGDFQLCLKCGGENEPLNHYEGDRVRHMYECIPYEVSHVTPLDGATGGDSADGRVSYLQLPEDELFQSSDFQYQFARDRIAYNMLLGVNEDTRPPLVGDSRASYPQADGYDHAMLKPKHKSQPLRHQGLSFKNKPHLKAFQPLMETTNSGSHGNGGYWELDSCTPPASPGGYLIPAQSKTNIPQCQDSSFNSKPDHRLTESSTDLNNFTFVAPRATRCKSTPNFHNRSSVVKGENGRISMGNINMSYHEMDPEDRLSCRATNFKLNKPLAKPKVTIDNIKSDEYDEYDYNGGSGDSSRALNKTLEYLLQRNFDRLI
ncbi:unnamed protein product [Owenia fusiformis]|uniref:Uncharacterized protein n=1 Tax=Owenia fusiformis TaxID=6347 RepID=A0A8S4PXU4_OWEFU|nr:unnamed protein product [Owenia fusiformis]